MGSQKLTARRKLARETRNALLTYIDLLHRVDDEDGTVKRKICLQDARQALDELTELEAQVEGYDYSSI